MAYRGPLLATVVFLFLTACATSPPPAPEIQRGEFAAIPGYLERLAAYEIKHNDITGLSIAIVAGGETLWAQGFGYADATDKTPVTAETLFRAGSVSKLFNAVRVMQLVEAGELTLGSDIRDYLPDFSIQSRFDTDEPITLTHLLTHQSGLPSDLAGGMWTRDQPAPTDTVFDYLAQTYVTAPPGEIFSYSNLGFDVIGEIIATTEGANYTRAMQPLLDDLGMKSATFSSSPKAPPVATGYRDGSLRTELSLRDVPAGGLSANARELAQILRLFTNGGTLDGQNLLTPQSLDTIEQDYTSESPRNLGTKAGLGVFHYQGKFDSSVNLYTHNGATHSHRALVLFSPAHRYGVALLSNSANASATLARLGKRSIELLHKATEGTTPQTRPLEWPTATAQDKLTHEHMIGYYATPAGLARFIKDGDTLKAKFAGKTFNTYQQLADGPHYLSYKLLGLVSVDLGQLGNIGFSTRTVDDETLLVGTDTRGHARVAGVKIESTPIPDAWRQRLGDYRLTTEFPVANIESGGLTIKDGFLIAHATLKEGQSLEYVLLPVGENQAIIAGQGRSLGETVFAKHDHQGEWIEFSGLKFERAD